MKFLRVSDGAIHTKKRSVIPITAPIFESYGEPAKGLHNPNVAINSDEIQNTKFISAGAFCDVFSATYCQQPVAVKTAKRNTDVCAKEHAEDMLKNEFELMKSMKHQNCVTLIGSGTIQGRQFLVMELLKNETLHDVLERHAQVLPMFVKRRRKNFLIRLSICKQLAEAVCYLHHHYNNEQTLIHRDIKPQNIGFSTSGVLKLMDFGTSKLIPRTKNQSEQQEDTFQMTGVTGTPRYMAPEVAAGLPYNEKVDTYSFGILCWNILTLKIPFEGLSVSNFNEKVVKNGLRPKCPSNWPSSLTQLVVSCWDPDWKNRPSFIEIASRLNGVLTAIQS